MINFFSGVCTLVWKEITHVLAPLSVLHPFCLCNLIKGSLEQLLTWGGVITNVTRILPLSESCFVVFDSSCKSQRFFDRPRCIHISQSSFLKEQNSINQASSQWNLETSLDLTKGSPVHAVYCLCQSLKQKMLCCV